MPSMPLQWLTLVAAVWLQSINGTNSNFPAYSSHLKKTLSISQLQLNNLASASDAGKLLGWIAGVAANHLPLWLVLLIGAYFGLVGYGVPYLFLSGQIPSLPYWCVFTLTVLAGNSICWINTVCYILAINNFPLDRQIAVGLSTGYVGLSAKIYTDLVDVVAEPDDPRRRAKAYLLLNSVAPMVVCALAAPLAREVDVGKSRVLSGGFGTMFIITGITGLFAVVTSYGTFSRFLSPVAVVVGMFVFLLLPLAAPLGERVRETLQGKCVLRVYDVEEGNSGNNNDINNKYGEESEGTSDHLVVMEEVGPMSMVRRLEFWLYFFGYLFGGTLGLVYLNNLGQIAESRGCSGTASLVSLSSAFGFFGRLLPSLFDYFYKKKQCAASTAMAMGSMTAPMCGAFFLLMISKHDFVLYIATTIIGICTGAITSIAVSMTTELFGTTNFGVNHNIMVLNIPIGSFLFGDLAALLYHQGGVDDRKGSSCTGQKCYETSFIIWGCLCALGTLLVLCLHARTKKIVHTT